MINTSSERPLSKLGKINVMTTHYLFNARYPVFWLYYKGEWSECHPHSVLECVCVLLQMPAPKFDKELFSINNSESISLHTHPHPSPLTPHPSPHPSPLTPHHSPLTPHHLSVYLQWCFTINSSVSCSEAGIVMQPWATLHLPLTSVPHLLW